MGLDQYLIKKTWIGGMYDHSEVRGTVDVSIRGEKLPIKLNRLSYVEEHIGKWRKANAIHKWFVDNCQEGQDDCRTAYVSKEHLTKLLDICCKVKDNPYEAPALLPTQGGFFFGDLSYDEYYFEDINHTISVLKTALEEKDEHSSIYYGSSW